ncbi:hypothetical protein [Actinosynnema sp. NPDC023587]|uniref:hypothetical protein n=1 Tax=Actinosynnema sp. NPDC023587 TaxID=3154695 RepID=UPI0033C7D126
MKSGVELVGVLLVVNGLAGIVHELFGWFGLWTIVTHLSFLDGYEIFANIGLAVVGAIVVAFASMKLSSAGR